MIVKNKREKLIIRMQQKGKKYYPLFSIVVINKEQANRGGKVKDYLGFFNPNNDNKVLFFNSQKLGFWLNKGIKINKTVIKYLVKIVVGRQIKNLWIKFFIYFFWYHSRIINKFYKKII